MDVHADHYLARVAGAIAEPARARMLCCLLDGHARTATELSVVAEISASTASAHLARLKDDHLVVFQAQGKHRYYQIANPDVATALEALLVVAGGAGLQRTQFTPNTPERLRHARTCYDHMAGTVAVRLHDHFAEQGWLAPIGDNQYDLTPTGEQQCYQLGLDLPAMRKLRRRFACPCLDWSERRPHLGGALGAALLQLALKKGWVEQDLDSRALSVPLQGQRQMLACFGLSGLQ
ncbi:ArsR family transcriptional regulator [Duganella sp. Leaf126]|nr:ArsR family transcriptional regulator [Duganella sp. Leaf126]